MTTHEAFMREALREAALDGGEVPVGAVIVYGGEIIARAHNEREERAYDGEDAPRGATAAPRPFAHAEMLAMARACEALHTRRLRGCALYVTLEPCPMCAGAMLLALIDRCVFGAFDARRGCCGSVYHLPGDPALGGNIPCFGGVLEEECRAMLRDFFEGKRLK